MAGLKDDLTPKNTQPPGLLVSILKIKFNRQVLKPSIPQKILNRRVLLLTILQKRLNGEVWKENGRLKG